MCSHRPSRCRRILPAVSSPSRVRSVSLIGLLGVLIIVPSPSHGAVMRKGLATVEGFFNGLGEGIGQGVVESSGSPLKTGASVIGMARDVVEIMTMLRGMQHMGMKEQEMLENGRRAPGAGIAGSNDISRPGGVSGEGARDATERGGTTEVSPLELTGLKAAVPIADFEPITSGSEKVSSVHRAIIRPEAQQQRPVDVVPLNSGRSTVVDGLPLHLTAQYFPNLESLPEAEFINFPAEDARIRAASAAPAPIPKRIVRDHYPGPKSAPQSSRPSEPAVSASLHTASLQDQVINLPSERLTIPLNVFMQMYQNEPPPAPVVSSPDKKVSIYQARPVEWAKIAEIVGHPSFTRYHHGDLAAASAAHPVRIPSPAQNARRGAGALLALPRIPLATTTKTAPARAPLYTAPRAVRHRGPVAVATKVTPQVKVPNYQAYYPVGLSTLSEEVRDDLILNRYFEDTIRQIALDNDGRVLNFGESASPEDYTSAATSHQASRKVRRSEKGSEAAASEAIEAIESAEPAEPAEPAKPAEAAEAAAEDPQDSPAERE